MKHRTSVYLMAGGDFRKPAAMIERITSILCTTGKEHPAVGYIGTASDDDPGFFKFTSDVIKGAGAHSVTLVRLANATADIGNARSLLATVDALFISGGDVEEGMRWLNHHKLVPYMKQLYDKGVVFFGISAGSIMLGTQWVRWEDPKNDASAELFDCMGIVPIVCDTHAEKDKWEELQTAVALIGKNGKGYGIPSGGTLVIQPDGALAALDKPVVVYENSAAGVTRSGTIACK